MPSVQGDNTLLKIKLNKYTNPSICAASHTANAAFARQLVQVKYRFQFAQRTSFQSGNLPREIPKIYGPWKVYRIN
jgi:hypothetical protein